MPACSSITSSHGIAVATASASQKSASSQTMSFSGILDRNRALVATHGPPGHAAVHVLDHTEVMRLGDVLVDEGCLLAFQLAGCKVIRDLAKRERHGLVSISKENGTGKVNRPVRRTRRLPGTCVVTNEALTVEGRSKSAMAGSTQ